MTDSPADRVLDPIRNILWALFLVLTAVAFVVMPFEIGEAQVREHISTPALRDFLLGFLGIADPLWIVLAASVVYLHLVKTDGLHTARRWALIILASAAVVGTAGALSGLPFGPIAYTGRLGARVAGVLPFGLPLLWLVIVGCSRYAVLAAAPGFGRGALAAGTGLLALLTDLNLEPVAWKVRAWWLWYPLRTDAPDHPPHQNYLGWFMVAALLAAAFPETRVGVAQARQTRPILILALMNAVFLTAHIVRALRN